MSFDTLKSVKRQDEKRKDIEEYENKRKEKMDDWYDVDHHVFDLDSLDSDR